MIKEIIKDRDLILDVNDYDIILLASNILCTMGRGLLYKISINFPDVKIANLMTKYEKIKKSVLTYRLRDVIIKLDVKNEHPTRYKPFGDDLYLIIKQIETVSE